LGDSLALGRMVVSASGTAAENFDVGAFTAEEIQFLEVDVHGRLLRFEIFAENRLGDAVVRLYERYAELLSDGPERTRATATARPVAVWGGPPDLDRFAASVAPRFECMDRRVFGTWSARGAEEWLQHWRLQLDLVTGGGPRIEDVLALEPAAYLIRATYAGTNLASGGAYENHLLALFVLGADGLLERAEAFEGDAEADALARFDELTAEAARFAGEPSRAAERGERRVRANAATANAVRTDAAIAARDADALPTLCADSSEVVDHVRGVTYDRRGLLA